MAAARNHPPSDRVPYAFEKRIMARLTAAPLDLWGLWSQMLWRAAVSCVAIMLCCSAWIVWRSNAFPGADFSQQFESAVFALVDQLDDSE
jgi:hypothetical protein